MLVARASRAWRNGLVSDRLVAAIAAIEREERQSLGQRQAVAATRARTAESHVLVAGVLAFITILIAGLMVRRDVLERRKATSGCEDANATLADAVAEAQRRGEEITRLARLSHFLQGCRSPEEACLVIEKTARTLFEAAGALYLSNGDRFERAAAWDEGRALEPAFPARGVLGHPAGQHPRDRSSECRTRVHASRGDARCDMRSARGRRRLFRIAGDRRAPPCRGAAWRLAPRCWRPWSRSAPGSPTCGSGRP